MTPAIRAEIQEWLVRTSEARKRTRTPDRRNRKPWPRVWVRNDADYAYCARMKSVALLGVLLLMAGCASAPAHQATERRAYWLPPDADLICTRFVGGDGLCASAREVRAFIGTAKVAP